MTLARVSKRTIVGNLTLLRRHRSLLFGYHGLGTGNIDTDPHRLLVPPEFFQKQVEVLLEAGFKFTTVTQYARLQQHGNTSGYAVLTFDDGMVNNYLILRGILQSYRIPATIYIPTGLIDQPNPWLKGESSERIMSEGEIRSLAADGIEIGAHSVSHGDMSLMSYEECLREASESKDGVESIVQTVVPTFSYPYNHYSGIATAAVRDAGFETAVTGGYRGDSNLMALGRIMINSRDVLPLFFFRIMSTQMAGPADCWRQRTARRVLESLSPAAVKSDLKPPVRTRAN